MSAVIEVENIQSGYNEQLVLRDVSVSIKPGEIMAILGTSGCGKTTLLKNMIGLLQPSQGDIRLFGKSILSMDESELNDTLKNVGVLFQGGALLNSLPLWSNLAIPLEQHTNFSQEMIVAMVRQKLALVGLTHAFDLLPGELSGGMRKRAALARAIALDPQILFADEPGAGLDPVTTLALDQLLLSLKKKLGMTVVVVTHEVASIRRIADRVTFLQEGQALFCGTLQRALKSDIPEVRAFFDSYGV